MTRSQHIQICRQIILQPTTYSHALFYDWCNYNGQCSWRIKPSRQWGCMYHKERFWGAIITQSNLTRFYPLCTNPPIIRPDSYPAIGQYDLYFFHKAILDRVFFLTIQYSLYWTVLKRGRPHPPIAACERLAVEQMNVPNVRNPEKRVKTTLIMFNIIYIADNMWNIVCFPIQYRIYWNQKSYIELDLRLVRYSFSSSSILYIGR